MDKQEQLKFFTTFKKEKIDFEVSLENIFLEFIQKSGTTFERPQLKSSMEIEYKRDYVPEPDR